ncbi:MAG: hypothetical protein Kow0079_05040 [Vicingaceae bacterium]|jgi:uncharacterized protein involved in exopolysaccharide biosynthesis
MEKNSSYDFDSGNLLAFFYQWRKPLLIITVAAAVISAVVSLLIENKYKSTVVMFPTQHNSISKALIAENFGGKDDVLAFGEEEQAEQLLQILNSDEIRNRIIEKYDLMHHYEIEDDDKYKYTTLQKMYESNVKFDRTEFMSVEIEVLDKNPDTAAMIANDIAALVDSVQNRMRKEIAVQAFKIVEEEYNNNKAYVKSLEDSLDALRALGINDYESQAERLHEQLAKAIVDGKKNAVKELEERIKILSKYGGAYVSIRDQLEYEKKQLTFLRGKYNEAKVDAEKELEHKFIVNNAFPAEKKSYPIRWLIVVVSTFAAFLFAVFAILIWNAYQNVKQQVEAKNK